jgi:hypothetical protein
MMVVGLEANMKTEDMLEATIKMMVVGLEANTMKLQKTLQQTKQLLQQENQLAQLI